jgi:alcohol dehydrogenase class IV
VLAAIAAFKAELGVTQGLADIGVAASDIAALARNAMGDPCLLTNPRQPTVGEIESIYEQARRSGS